MGMVMKVYWLFSDLGRSPGSDAGLGLCLALLSLSVLAMVLGLSFLWVVVSWGVTLGLISLGLTLTLPS